MQLVSLGAVVQVAAEAGPASYGHVTGLCWIPTQHLEESIDPTQSQKS